SCTVACQLSREQTPADGAPQGAEPAHSTAKIPYTTQRDAIPPIESAVYFGVAELLTNAVRHAHASRARVSLARDEAGLVVEVEDDGRGGADERADGGLAGMRRRLAVFDGTLEITSPPGGPTRVRMALPCESL
ncbi:hypothetical protein DTL70_11470, partial [Streptomyces diacarni]